MLPENMGVLFAIGGKVRDVKADASAYVHRNANYIFEMECAWAPIDKKEVVQAQQAWLTRPRRKRDAPSTHFAPRWSGACR